MQNNQFIGLANEDPNAHISNFLEVYDIVKYKGVSDEVVRLRLFPFSLGDKAIVWLKSQPPDSITSLNNLVHNFLENFFSPASATQVRMAIHEFAQHEGEPMHEA